MAQIGFPLMLEHIACFLISLFFLFEQMFITTTAKWLPSSSVITGFWVQSWISGSWTWFSQIPHAQCRRDRQWRNTHYAPHRSCCWSALCIWISEFTLIFDIALKDYTQCFGGFFFKWHCWPCSCPLSLWWLCCGLWRAARLPLPQSAVICLPMSPRATTIQPRGVSGP